RNHLINHGRIFCKKGRRGQAPIYEMVPFGGDMDPSITPSMFHMTSRTKCDSTLNSATRTPHSPYVESTVEPDKDRNQLSVADRDTQGNDTTRFSPEDTSRNTTASHSVERGSFVPYPADALYDVSIDPSLDQSNTSYSDQSDDQSAAQS